MGSRRITLQYVEIKTFTFAYSDSVTKHYIHELWSGYCCYISIEDLESVKKLYILAHKLLLDWIEDIRAVQNKIQTV